MKLVPNLYALRFVLAVFVLLFHIPLISDFFGLPFAGDSPIFKKGLVAVYYFFTLSGFLIIRSIYVQLESVKGFKPGSFYMRRIKRLYPVYYLILGTGILVYHYLFPLLQINFFIDYKLSDLLYHYVFFMPNVFTRVNPDVVGPILVVLWSIGIEEQFYLVAPLLLLVFKKNTLALLITLLIISLVLLYFYQPFYFYNNYYFYFISGGLIAVLNLKKQFRILRSPFVHIPVYIVFILIFFTSYFDTLNFFNFHLLHMVTSTLLIGLIADYPLFIIKNRFINYCGQISYGIYMYHCVVLTVALYFISTSRINLYLSIKVYSWSLIVLMVAATIFISHLSFRYFERLFYRSRVNV